MLRAVIYARCSTEEESQIDALKNQVAEARDCIRQQGWILVDEYVESKSGTSTKGRNEYNRLFEDLLLDKFDIIVIKSQDRLMRNTKDWYIFVDRLTTSGKKLYMYIDRKFYSTDDALITGIKAILAEDYSRELSKKINNAHRNRQKSGGKPILTSRVYGLRKSQNGTYEIIPEEAAVKVHMYELFAVGYGARSVSNILKSEGIVNRKGVPFNPANILRMVKSPLNMGTVVMNKVHFDFNTKQRVKMDKEEQYIYPNKVPAIVSEELWLKANRMIQARTGAKAKPDDRIFGKNPGKYSLSGKLVCGLCGKPYYRSLRSRNGTERVKYDWKCRTYIENGRNTGDLDRPDMRKIQGKQSDGCDNIHLNEDKLNIFLEEIVDKRYSADKQKIQSKMLNILSVVLQEKGHKAEYEAEINKKDKLEAQLGILLDKLLEGVISDDMYKTKQKDIEKKLEITKEKINSFEERAAKGNELQERLKCIQKALESDGYVEKATVAGMLDDIEMIVIYPERMEIHFSYSKLLGLTSKDLLDDVQKEVMVIEYGSHFNPRLKQKEDLQTVVDLMKNDPEITAKQIAEKVGISTSGVWQRIAKLKRENRIRFIGKGGKGYWEVLQE